MEYEQKCLICGNDAKVHSSQNFGAINECKKCGIIEFEREAEHYLEGEEGNKFRACLYYYFTHHKLNKDKPYFISDVKTEREECNILTIEEIMNLYPKNISERIDMILLNFSKIGGYVGDKICLTNEVGTYEHFLFFDKKSSSDEKNSILNMMVAQKLLKEDGSAYASGKYRFIIDFKGWKRIDELNKINAKHNKGFVAIWFDRTNMKLENYSNYQFFAECKSVSCFKIYTSTITR